MLVWFDKSAIMQSETRSSAADRVEKINLIIDTLIDAQIAFTADPNRKEYKLDTGQTKVSVAYRDLDALSAAIISWERIKNIYVNRYNGRMTRLMDSKNFPNWLGLNC